MLFWLCFSVCGDKLNDEYQLTNHDLKDKFKFQDSNIFNWCSILKKIENAKKLPLRANQSHLPKKLIIYRFSQGRHIDGFTIYKQNMALCLSAL